MKYRITQGNLLSKIKKARISKDTGWSYTHTFKRGFEWCHYK
jgi:hypothetical protein